MLFSPHTFSLSIYFDQSCETIHRAIESKSVAAGSAATLADLDGKAVTLAQSLVLLFRQFRRSA